jgi:GH35 family endo-1,4-beta-xylanase
MIGDIVFAFETTKDNLLKAITLSLKESGKRINAIGTNHIEYEICPTTTTQLKKGM